MGYVITGMFSKIHLDIIYAFGVYYNEYVFKDPNDVSVLRIPGTYNVW